MAPSFINIKARMYITAEKEALNIFVLMRLRKGPKKLKNIYNNFSHLEQEEKKSMIWIKITKSFTSQKKPSEMSQRRKLLK